MLTHFLANVILSESMNKTTLGEFLLRCVVHCQGFFVSQIALGADRSDLEDEPLEAIIPPSMLFHEDVDFAVTRWTGS